MRQGKQDARHHLDVLVGHHAEDQHEGHGIAEIRGERPRRRRVVGAVEEQRRGALDDDALEPSRPLRPGQRGGGGAQVHGHARGPRFLQQAQRHERIVALMSAGERAHAVVREARGLNLEPVARRGRFLLDGGAGLGGERAEHGGAPPP